MIVVERENRGDSTWSDEHSWDITAQRTLEIYNRYCIVAEYNDWLMVYVKEDGSGWIHAGDLRPADQKTYTINFDVHGLDPNEPVLGTIAAQPTGE